MSKPPTRGGHGAHQTVNKPDTIAVPNSQPVQESSGIKLVVSSACPPGVFFMINDDAWEAMQKQLDEAVLRLAEQGLL